MDGTILIIYLLTAYVGGVTNGLAGFALGLVVSGIWLHLLAPAQVALLTVCYGVATQAYSIWNLKHGLNWQSVWPYIVGGAIGAPSGAVLLHYANPDSLRVGIGALLIAYSIYGLTRPMLTLAPRGAGVNLGIGVLNGLLGGLTGLAGVIVTVWVQLQGLPKDVQRSIYQPILFVVLTMSAASLIAAGALTMQIAKLYFMGLPVLLAGTWSGLKLYGKLDDAVFRKVILVLLLFSGLSLVVPFTIFR